MANTIKLKRGSGSDPSASDLVVGEVAVRTDEGKLFTKKDDGTVAEISGGGGIDDGDKGDITVSNSGATFTIDDGVITNAKVNSSAAIDVSKLSGVLPLAGGTLTGGLTISNNQPKITFTEGDANPDFQIFQQAGVFKIKDLTAGSGRFLINTDGHIDITNRLDANGGLAVTGDITGTGGLTLTSTDTGSSAAPEFELYRNSASPADADYLGQLKFTGESDDGSKEVYAKMTAKIDDASSGTEDGLFEFALRKAGSNNIGARLTSTDLKLINGTGLEVAGDTTMTGDLTISSSAPTILLTDTNNNPDYELKNYNGVFELDQGTSDTKFKITTDGHIAFPNDDQEIRIGQGSDLTLFHDGTDSFIKQATATPLKIQGNGSNGAEVHIQARPDEEGIKLLNNSGESKVELYYDNTKRIETTDYGSLTSGVHSISNGIMEIKQEIGTSHTFTSGYHAIAVDPTIANGVTVTVPSGAVWSIV